MKKLYTKLLLLLFTLTIFQLRGQVVINEFSAANLESNTDNFGEHEDWIELYNTSNAYVDLSGYHLSDRTNNPDKWTFPDGSGITANGYLLIWASGRDLVTGNNIHTNFKITQTKNSEDVVFADPSGNIIDSNPINIPNQLGHSRARTTNGGPTWGVALIPTPGYGNGQVKGEYAQKPSISPSAGFYTDQVTVTIENTEPNSTIYYTTDGGDPDTGSGIYTGPFTVTSTTVVKAAVYSNDSNIPHSFTDYHTFFINEVHTIPVVSVSGRVLPNLFNGQQFNPKGTFELFDETGDRVADGSGEFNKHGNDSWAYDQRGVDFVTRDQMGDDYALKYKIFPDFTDRKEFQRIILKAAANDNYPEISGSAHIRDAYVHELSQLANLELDERTYEPCIVYLNGSYWGVYELREKVDDPDFTSYYYNQDEQDIDFIKTWGGTWQEYGSWVDWYALTDFIHNNDMADPANYAYVTEQFDVLSLIDYMILHSLNVSSDWLNWNTAWWRGRNPEGGARKWKYILWDEDATFGHYINYTSIPDQSPTADPCNPELISPWIDFEGHVELLTDLSVNEDFFSLYINRYADMNNSYFSCDFMIPLLDTLIARIAPEMPRHCQKWGGTVAGWEANVEQLRNFIETRCTIIDEGIVDCYEDEGITGPYEVLINVDPPESGKVKANTVIGQNYPWQTTYFGGIGIELTAIPENGGSFLYWTVNNNIYDPNQFSDIINMELTQHDEITAHFTGSIPCGEPFDISSQPTMTSATIEWLSAGDVLAHELRYRPAGSSEDWEVMVEQGDAVTLFGLDVCTQYEVELRTICSFSVSNYTEFNFTTECVNSTEEVINGIAELQVYPNPSSEDLFVDLVLDENSDIYVELLTVSGQKVFQQGYSNLPFGKNTIRLEEEVKILPAGIYFLKISNNGESVVRRIVRS
ncbi:MAG: CotH kinase family protein [Saprospiraceae bacterium]|nr:CotH kinase family protein [Saprospiraceae bacterium]MCB9325605.1 CotH kinase family protein [Lewinellaceae bacterium]